MADDIVQVPADLTLISDEELAEVEERATAEFDRLSNDDNVTAEGLEYQMRLANDIDRINAEKAGRTARAELAAETERARMLETREALRERVHGPSDGEGGGGGNGAVPGELSAEVLAAITEAASRGVAQTLVAAAGERRVRGNGGLATLADARKAAPPVDVSKNKKLAVTAGVDIPGVARGSNMTSLDDIVEAFQRAAKSAPVTRNAPQERLVCTIRNEFEHTVDDRTSPAQMDELINYLRRPEKMQSLVAGGGWCAPSEIKYDFFNVSGVDGLIDLPTVGISRGGLKFPVSPSIADAFGSKGLAPFAVAFTSGSDPWVWTETDDIAAVTGSPTKPTIRVACPSFSEQRLECYGITLTAGNLTDDAYPEATAHTLRLLLTAWQHAQNARIISQMVALSTTVATGLGSAGSSPVYQTVVNGIDLACTDYRAKFAIPDEVPLETVLPYWVKDLIQADLAWRAFGNTLSVSDTEIDQYLAARNIRVQWVGDWQFRGAGQFGNPNTSMIAWPTTASIMVYAAGTFIKGNGLTLDLGVVRDSVLNATNDFTAAWSEECHLVAKVGNESRVYNLNFGVNGATGGSAYVLGTPTARI
jgi:hypothetical protein